MKFLNGLEELQIKATSLGRSVQIDGTLPWVTNLRKEGFDVAAAVHEETSASLRDQPLVRR